MLSPLIPIGPSRTPIRPRARIVARRALLSARWSRPGAGCRAPVAIAVPKDALVHRVRNAAAVSPDSTDSV